MRVLHAVVRLVGCGLVGAAGWTVNVTAGLVLSGLAALALTYLPDGDAE